MPQAEKDVSPVRGILTTVGKDHCKHAAVAMLSIVALPARTHVNLLL